MVNLFDVGAGLAANRVPTDKTHHDGSPIARSLSDVAVMMDHFNRDQLEDKKAMSDLRRSSSRRKSNITPIKMLIAQEMSKEVGFKQSPPNLVAKLMGLDGIPIHLPKSITQRSQSKSHLQQSRSLSHTGRRAEYSHHGRSFSDDQMQHRFDEYEIYDMWEQSQRGNSKKENSLGKGRRLENSIEKKMALVREKFMEAKRLAPDEKLRHSKEFHDAVEVLSSNRDLFLKFLQEPDSLLLKNAPRYHSIPSTPETKRITILKPSKVVDNGKFSELGKKSGSISEYSSPYGFQEVDDYPSQPTRIVVLKPGHEKSHDIKSVVPPPSSSPGILHGDNFSEDDEDHGVEEVQEVGNEITRHRRDETLLPSVFSNGYIGDDSSFNRSENEYMDGNLSDSEVASPRHSWDFMNRVDSPYSISSFRSYSPESSVCREAKKRLSERWATMSSNQSSFEQRRDQKSSVTLGEMLALSESKKSGDLEGNGESRKDQESAESSSSIIDTANKEEKEEACLDSPKNLSRSKSVPVSCSIYEDRLNVQIPEPDSLKAEEPNKKSSGKSSLKRSLSSLFFSRNRKSSKDKTSQSKDESRSTTAETARSSELPNEKVGAGRISNDSHEQPNPISVLDQLFDEDDKITPESSGQQLSSQMLKSNLIGKSPPIGSLARTLSWDDPYGENTSPYYLKTRTLSPGDDEEEENEQDWLMFVRNLLIAAGLEGEDPSNSSFPNSFSPESPLDPSLRDKFVAADDKADLRRLSEAKIRQRRSNRKLAFDCASSVIADMVGGGGHHGSITAERVWAQMKGWFTEEAAAAAEGGFGDSAVVERVARKEAAGRWWVEKLKMEVDKLGMEIEEKMIQELVDEAVGEFSGTAN